MANNLTGIPFSTEDEGVSYPTKAKAAVVMATSHEERPLDLSEVYVVWFAYTLGSYKALVSSSRFDGRYFEVIYDVKNDRTFVDFYLKIGQEIIYHTDGVDQTDTFIPLGPKESSTS